MVVLPCIYLVSSIDVASMWVAGYYVRPLLHPFKKGHGSIYSIYIYINEDFQSRLINNFKTFSTDNTVCFHVKMTSKRVNLIDSEFKLESTLDTVRMFFVDYG